MTDSEIRLALIGTGGIAGHHMRSMAELKALGLGDFKITAICDVNQDAVDATAGKLEDLLGHRPTTYTSYETMLATEQLDAADLCLPHGLHHVIGNACMEAGLHVLCEKPLGITVATSRAMAETADRTGKILSTAVPKRREPGQRAVHWLFNENKLLGQPLAFFHHMTWPWTPRVGNAPIPESRRWRMDRLRSGGGMVMDSGFHYADSLRYLLGEVDTVYAQTRAIESGTPVGLADAREDTVMVTYTFKSGVIGTWSWCLTAKGAQAANISYYCSNGSLQDVSDNRFRVFHIFERRGLEPDRIEQGLLTFGDGSTMSLAALEQVHQASIGEEQREFLFPRGMWDGFTYEIHEFFECIRGNRVKPEVDGWEGLASLALCEAVYESALIGEPVKVADVASGKINAYQAPIDEHWGL
ncbi:MAG: Gfo/Idh/MocA family protein [Anaerolineae bacterium]|jgi:UDP-N-acetyl-2-amino-2-deoxyglucuronate dehydrogenase|nr:Gfo/Idh/MocA family oxidoreductase [Chloroflexota bacterium]